MATARYHEGDWFGVPLRDGGYAVGIIARSNPSAALLGYFFGPRRGRLPSLQEVDALTPAEAILVGKFGHLGLLQGDWPIIGRVVGWDRNAWPMPVFVRREELTGRSFEVFYDDDDPAKLIREVPVDQDPGGLRATDGLMGAGFVEKKLTALLT